MCNIWCVSFADKLPQYLSKGASILEVGSRTVNGEVRAIFEPSSSTYIGVDIEEGPGVDLILDACSLTKKFPLENFDAVITTEMLEHCHDWRTALLEIMKVLKPGGHLLLTTRSPGFDLHGYPDDHNRFSMDDIKNIFSPAGNILDIQDDMTLDFPCGIGVIVKKTISSSMLDSWAKHLESIEVDKATSIIFGKNEEKDPEKREQLLYSYFMDLVSRREEEIRRLNQLVIETSEWGKKLNDESKNKDNEIIRLQKLLHEQTEWGQNLSANSLSKDDEIKRLQQLVQEQSNWALSLKDELNLKDEQIIKLQGAINSNH